MRSASVVAGVSSAVARLSSVLKVSRLGALPRVKVSPAAGAPVSYTEYAAKSGRPAAVRAAASACARNAAAMFVPCHRVLRNDGSLGGFRWGLPVKRWLLDHETAR